MSFNNENKTILPLDDSKKTLSIIAIETDLDTGSNYSGDNEDNQSQFEDSDDDDIEAYIGDKSYEKQNLLDSYEDDEPIGIYLPNIATSHSDDLDYSLSRLINYSLNDNITGNQNLVDSINVFGCIIYFIVTLFIFTFFMITF
mgnify:FL=1